MTALGDDIKAGAAAGIISPAQAEALIGFIAARTAQAAPAMDRLHERQPNDRASDLAEDDAEGVRFARGFHDVFLAIGLVILMVGLATSLTLLVGVLAGYAGAAVAWLLAEYFARRRRLVLPGICIAAGFVLMVGVTTGALADMTASGGAEDAVATDMWGVLAGLVAALAASGAFYARFRLPFALALIAASATASLASLAEIAAPGHFEALANPLFLIAGGAAFAAAMIYDLGDPQRATARADKAFWLHLVAAPLIVHSGVGSIVEDATAMSAGEAAAIFAIVAGLALVALVIDRRAPLVAGLTYLGVAISVVMRHAALDDSAVIGVSLLFLGASVVALGAGWRGARRTAVATLIPARLAAHLPILRPDPT